MDNTRARRHDLEVIEGLGTPLEELEALAVSLELELLVSGASVTDTGGIDTDRVINDEIDGAKRVNLGRISTKTLHGISHGGKIDDSWDTTANLKNESVS